MSKLTNQIMRQNISSTRIGRELIKDIGVSKFNRAPKRDLRAIQSLIKEDRPTLYNKAKVLNIKGRSKLKRKAQLISSIYKQQKIKPVVPPRPRRRVPPPIPPKPVLKPKRRKLTPEQLRLRKELIDLSKSISTMSMGDSIDIDFEDYDNELKYIILAIIKGTFDNRRKYRYTIKIGNVNYTLSDSNRDRLFKVISKGLVNVDEATESDGEVHVAIYQEDGLTISIRRSEYNKRQNEGSFFSYTHNLTDVDLTRYGVFRIVSSKNYMDNCIIRALRKSDLPIKIKDKLDSVKRLINNRVFPMRNLKQLAHKLKIYITVRKIDFVRGNCNHINKYGNPKDSPAVEIGLIDEHYFIIDKKTKVTGYSLKHFDEVKDLKDWNRIYEKRNGSYRRTNSRFMSSFNLINELIKNKDKFLKPIPYSGPLMETQFYKKVDDEITNLEYELNDYQKRYLENDFVVLKTEKDKIDEIIKSKLSKKDNKIRFRDYIKQRKMIKLSTAGNRKVYNLDFEADPNNVHIPILCHVYTRDRKESVVFEGLDCGKQALNYMNKENKYGSYDEILIIAHNAGYDNNFIIRYVHSIKILEKGTKLINETFKYRDCNFRLKDSYCLISTKLSKFPAMFNLKGEKEIFPYKLLTSERLNEPFVKVSDAIDEVGESKYKQFMINVRKTGSYKNIDGVDYFDIIKYAKFYCQRDCEILNEGYLTFRKWMKELTGFDIDNCFTSAGLAHDYFITKGCYDGVLPLSDVPREFIQKCVVGGRTMCCQNKKQYYKAKYSKTGKVIDYLCDYDACSLYPSAMKRLYGYLKGAPKIIKDEQHFISFYNQLKQTEDLINSDKVDRETLGGLFVEVEVTEINRQLDFPLGSYKNKDGVRVFSNELAGKRLFLDFIGLRDFEEFQDAKFKFIRGYYFDEGRNSTINRVIEHLYNERKIKKKEGNPIQAVYKLIMNSAYGKTILKPIETSTQIFDDEERFDKYFNRNYNSIIEYVDIKTDGETKRKVKTQNSILNHATYPQVGVEVLSMSKRIMNEVFDIAQANNLKIYYQDTDSMHIGYQDLQVLERKFKEKYGRELEGKDLGNFHVDFELQDSNGDEAHNVKAVESYFLGKKMYIDQLVGEVNNKEVSGYHIRMKGIPQGCFHHKCKEMNISPMQMYEKINGLCKEEEEDQITFDLTKGNTLFKRTKDHKMVTLKEFTRRIKVDSSDIVMNV